MFGISKKPSSMSMEEFEELDMKALKLCFFPNRNFALKTRDPRVFS